MGGKKFRFLINEATTKALFLVLCLLINPNVLKKKGEQKKSVPIVVVHCDAGCRLFIIV